MMPSSTFLYDYQVGDLFQGGDFDYDGAPPEPAWLIRLFGIDFFHAVSVLDYKPEEAGQTIPLAEAFPQLRSFTTAGTVGDDDLRTLRGLKLIEEVVVSQAANVTDEGMQALCGLRSLRRLVVNGPQITDRSGVHVADLDDLEYLDLSGTSIADATGAAISGLNKLKRVNLSATRVTDLGIAGFDGLPNLTVLFLVETSVRGKTLKGRRFARLARLALSLTDIHDDVLAEIGQMTALKELYLNKTMVTDLGVQCLYGLRNLEVLGLRHTKITNTAIMSLIDIQGLRRLDLTGTQIDDDSLTSFRQMSNLTTLKINETRISPEGFARLKRDMPHVQDY